MSASPSQPPSGPPSTTPNSGPAAQAPRRRPPVSIFTQKKKPPIRKPAPGAPGKSGAPSATNPSEATANGSKGKGKAASNPNSTTADPSAPKGAEGMSFQEFPIIIHKSAFMQGRHYHAMKLQPRLAAQGVPTAVNPYDEKQFTRPLRLHRRHARDKMEVAPPAGEQSDAANASDDKDRELLNLRRAERKAEREANQALIAPTGGPEQNAKKPGGPQQHQKKKQQKKVEDVYYNANDPRQRQRAQLRYEEARPWHLEDFENKNIWVGSYEEPLSETSVLFEVATEGFNMVPVEKWYKFTQTNRLPTMDSEAVEKHMGKKFKPPRWFLGTQAANDEERKREVQMQRERHRAQTRRFEDDDAAPTEDVKEEYRADVDEIDFEFNDEFQDDDEGMIFGDQQDDDAREIEKRIREEMRSANLGGTGVKDEDRDWDAEEQKERREEQEEKRRTRRMRKQLIKKERKNEYDSESDHGEFSEGSDSEESEEEREKATTAEEEQRKQQDEAARKVNGDNNNKSGASSKGTNTPTGRAEKKDPTRLGASLKRPGSPDLSEMSGNESSRKKAKGINGTAVAGRALSAEATKPRKQARTHTPGGYGSGSETDASRAGAGGRPKIRLKHSPSATPAGGNSPSNSRAASPETTGSGAKSPQRREPVAAASGLGFPTLQEVKDAIPAEGTGIPELVGKFKGRVAKEQARFIALVKLAGRQDASTRRIMRKADDA